MTRAIVLGRKRRGRPIGRVVRETRRALEAAGWTVESGVVLRKRELRDAAAGAVRDGVDVVVAVGGDGVVLQVVQALAETKVALGIIPMGTGNLVATNLGIPRDKQRAAQVILGGGQRRIDLGRAKVDGVRRYFAVACGVGFDAEVMKATSKGEKDRWGKLAYVASAIRQSRHMRNAEHAITLDGKRSTMKAAQVFVANFGRTGMAMEPRLEVLPDDGLLDVMVVRGDGPLRGLMAGWEAMRQDGFGESSDGHAFRARATKVTVDTEPSRRVEIDGSVIGSTPVKVTIRPDALTVMVPRSD